MTLWMQLLAMSLVQPLLSEPCFCLIRTATNDPISPAWAVIERVNERHRIILLDLFGIRREAHQLQARLRYPIFDLLPGVCRSTASSTHLDDDIGPAVAGICA